ncbi:hypothetical protein CDD83_669 [Cordyceps sp. RAO-2017]|nr:hypothetical protein CDD83_669 [Cordyceps sp. RAO-2017]
MPSLASPIFYPYPVPCPAAAALNKETTQIDGKRQTETGPSRNSRPSSLDARLVHSPSAVQAPEHVSLGPGSSSNRGPGHLDSQQPQKHGLAGAMVGSALYTDDEIAWVLDQVIAKAKPADIQQGFSHFFGREIGASQVRYLKNKYGRDPRFK